VKCLGIVIELVKLKIQGKKPDLYEFKKRLTDSLVKMDCELLNETPMLPNMWNRRRDAVPSIFRQYLFLGMKRRKENGE
jgi:hypothetical protein